FPVDRQAFNGRPSAVLPGHWSPTIRTSPARRPRLRLRVKRFKERRWLFGFVRDQTVSPTARRLIHDAFAGAPYFSCLKRDRNAPHWTRYVADAAGRDAVRLQQTLPILPENFDRQFFSHLLLGLLLFFHDALFFC